MKPELYQWKSIPRHLKKQRRKKNLPIFYECTKIVFVYSIWHKKHLLDYMKLTNKQAKPIKIHSNLGQIFFPKNKPIFLLVQLSETWVISMKNSHSSQLIWGKISGQIKIKFCPNLTNKKMNFSKKRDQKWRTINKGFLSSLGYMHTVANIT